MGIALIVAFNRKPLILNGTMIIMVIALVIRRLPYTIRSSVATLQQIPITVEEAAISLGSSKAKTFVQITVPVMANGIISGAILSWVTIITELSTAICLYTVRTQTLTLAIYTYVSRGNDGIAAALATILSLTTVVSLLLFMKLSKSKDVTLSQLHPQTKSSVPRKGNGAFFVRIRQRPPRSPAWPRPQRHRRPR